ncbi:MAG: MFS transporter [Chloroflexi bacterium]|nr:MFS transporter [Chloroflexota bacterium]
MSPSRNLTVLTLSVIILSLGQNMWFGFAPEFLRALGAGALVIGAFSSLQTFFEALYQFPGGWMTDRFGLRRALVTANVAAAVGYFIYLISPNFSIVFLGLPFVMVWPAFVVPATTGLLAETAAPQASRRAFNFAAQEVITRLPLLIAPVAGGLLITLLSDVQAGVRVGLGITLAAAMLTLFLQGAGYQSNTKLSEAKSIFGIWQEMDGGLKRLLASEILVRYAEVLPRALLVLYAIQILNAPYWGFGLLLAVEAGVAILVRGPLAKLVDAAGYKQLLLMSFLATALFPITIVFAPSWLWLFAGYVISGLKAAGNPIRSALISDLVNPARSGQHVGLYESLVNLAVLPAGFIGGLLWIARPVLPFWLALATGLIGCVLFARLGPGDKPNLQ